MFAKALSYPPAQGIRCSDSARVCLRVPEEKEEDEGGEEEKARPYIVQFDNFLTADECNDLISVGAVPSRLTQSLGGHKRRPDGSLEVQRNMRRTSSSFFCFDKPHGCSREPIVETIAKRISIVTKTPEQNAAFLQFLVYNETQYFKGHHDFDPQHIDQPHGVRMMTFLCYLTNVTEGGETHFPQLQLKASPHAGRCILFPSVTNDDPWAKERWTIHEALPVIRGHKIAFMMVSLIFVPWAVLCCTSFFSLNDTTRYNLIVHLSERLQNSVSNRLY